MTRLSTGPPVLGRDPFAEIERAPDPVAALLPQVPPPRPRLREVPRRPDAGVRRLAEVPQPEPRDWLDRLLPADARHRVEALRQWVGHETEREAFGFDPEVARRTMPLLLALYHGWFRVKSEGHAHLPAEGAFVLAANHGGLLPFDGAMAGVDVLLHTDPPRLARPLSDRFVQRLPGIRELFERIGPVIASRESFHALLRDGQPVLVFPEGIDGIRKPVTQRYRLQHFHTGFVRQALLTRTPIVPLAILGSDDQAPILYDLQPLARRLGLPTAPITPTFPWFGPLGLLPYPVRYRLVYGRPFDFSERFGPEAADDERVVRNLANQVRRAIQKLVDQNR